jgi:flagellar FliL protein
MSKILNPKIIIPFLVVTALIGLVLYVLVAPASWWKPVYVRIESDETPAPQSHAETVSQPESQSQPQAVSHASPFQPGWGLMYELDTQVVNLAEPGGMRYLQASLVLEFSPLMDDLYKLEGEERALAEEDFRNSIDSRRPVIDDIVMSTLSSKTFNEITTIEGKQALKEELMAKINDALGYQGVVNIYFTDFVVQ